jgi:D-arabinose 1-dehydrogenase-like Zn-dependent alcohol dehydrogenase
MKVIETKQSLEELIRILENGLVKAKKNETRDGQRIVGKIYHRLRDYRSEYRERFKCDYNYSP